ncbi:MAG: entericidin A/B family lipoprotein [Brachymonas sp.]|nr:entericidin A/B family lipoprotein [Brachymonas sp.]
MKKMTTLLGVLAVALTLSACNTVKGVGRDVKAGGQAVENAATKAQQ